MDYATHCAELDLEGQRFVARLRQADPGATVPTCPGWTVDDLASHVAYVHRWAEGLVSRRAPVRLSGRDLGITGVTGDPEALAEGLEGLRVRFASSDPDAPMWAWGADQHLRFWARRMLHETLVHRIDLECALGVDHSFDPVIAVDAIDEFLVNLPAARSFSPDLSQLVGRGEWLTFRSDEGPSWGVCLEPEGFVVTSPTSSPDALLEGPATEMLLVLSRRRALGDSTCRVSGRGELVTTWLRHSSLA